MRSFAYIPITFRATWVIAVFCCTWSEAHVLSISSARNSWKLCSFSLVFLFGLYFDFLQNKHWSGRIAELTLFLFLELLLGTLPVAASSDGSLATCQSLLLVNAARQLRWYFMEFAGNSLSVEASKTGLWFWITAARYNVVHEEISLHWDNVVFEQPHIIHSSAIYRGAREIPRRGGSCQSWLLRKQGPQKRKHPYFVFFTLYCRVAIFRKNTIEAPYTLYFYERLVMLLRNVKHRN